MMPRPQAQQIADLRAILRTLLDRADYTSGMCRKWEPINVAIPATVLARAKRILQETA